MPYKDFPGQARLVIFDSHEIKAGNKMRDINLRKKIARIHHLSQRIVYRKRLDVG